MEHKRSILLVDDDRILAEMTKEYLESKDFIVHLFTNAIDGFTAFQNQDFDVCVLDVRMPMKDGFSLAEDIRSVDEHVPLIFLTGQNEKEDRIRGLSIGADDYIVKPFSMQELFLRINAILKRVSHSRIVSPSTSIGRFLFDSGSRELSIDDVVQKLSEIETQLLQAFLVAPDGRVTRDFLLNSIWQDDAHLKTRSLNVYISKLRKYLAADEHIEILNIHGTGYALVIKG